MNVVGWQRVLVLRFVLSVRCMTRCTTTTRRLRRRSGMLKPVSYMWPAGEERTPRGTHVPCLLWTGHSKSVPRSRVWPTPLSARSVEPPTPRRATWTAIYVSTRDCSSSAITVTNATWTDTIWKDTAKPRTPSWWMIVQSARKWPLKYPKQPVMSQCNEAVCRYTSGVHLSAIWGNTAHVQWIRCSSFIGHVLYFFAISHEKWTTFVSRSSLTWHNCHRLQLKLQLEWDMGWYRYTFSSENHCTEWEKCQTVRSVIVCHGT